MATTPGQRARGYRRSGSPLGAHLRNDSRVNKPDPSPSTTTSTSNKMVLTQAIALVPSEARECPTNCVGISSRKESDVQHNHNQVG